MLRTLAERPVNDGSFVAEDTAFAPCSGERSDEQFTPLYAREAAKLRDRGQKLSDFLSAF
jgi:hypothetical protein